MFTRSLLALYTAISLFVSLLAFSGGPLLVCQMTGEQMAPVFVKSIEEHGTCCALQASVSTDGGSRYALSNPGCCDLQQSKEVPASVAALAPATPELPAFLLARLPSVVLLPRLLPVVVPTVIPRESAPRPPPALSSVSPRAPPLFS